MSDQPITAEHLREIQSRVDRATTGPWKSFIEGRDHTSGSSFIRTAGDDIEMRGATDEDHDFIASARQDIPLLLAEIYRLREAAK